MEHIPNRAESWALLTEFIQSDALRKHALAVEAVMLHFCRQFDGDPVFWGAAGLLHDLDYEQYPDQHCRMTGQILNQRQIDPLLIRAVVSHGYGICSDVEPTSDCEKVLYTIDELTGLIHAAALMRPSRSVLDLELSSLKKKFKTPSFAAGVDREIIRRGAALLGWDLDRVMQETILAMRGVAESIGLAGTISPSST